MILPELSNQVAMQRQCHASDVSEFGVRGSACALTDWRIIIGRSSFFPEDLPNTTLVPSATLLTSLRVLSAFLFHGLFACFSSPFVDGISWIKYFKSILVFNGSIFCLFVLSFTQQRMKHPGVKECKFMHVSAVKERTGTSVKRE